MAQNNAVLPTHYNCQECIYRSVDYEAMAQHVVDVHGYDGRRSTCWYCKLFFRTHANFVQHEQTPQHAAIPQPKPASPGRPLQQKPNPMMPPQSVQQQFAPQHQQSMMPSESDFRDPWDDSPGMNTEEAESFFTLLSETDESKCISRLVCEMGASPDSGGEFGQTVVEIIGSLNDFPDGSKVSEYNEVLSAGMAEGLSAYMSKFSMCDEESYQLVKKAQLDNEE